ncbi:MAG: hypothetical protein ACREPX_11505 [Rhodanobacteraceae bacterium]
MPAGAHLVDFLANEFTGLRARRLTLSAIASRALDGSGGRHGGLLRRMESEL